MKRPVRTCAARKAVRSIVSRFAPTLSRFVADTRGLGAIEFAFIAPLLLMVYLTAFELTMGFSAVKRTTSASSVIADLVSQRQSVTVKDLENMQDVAASIFVPYGTEGMLLKITGIAVDATNNPKIAWSWANNGTTPYVQGSTPQVSENLLSPDSFLVRAELSVPHELLLYLPNLAIGENREITIYREYYFRQRIGNGITCGDC